MTPIPSPSPEPRPAWSRRFGARERIRVGIVVAVALLPILLALPQKALAIGSHCDATFEMVKAWAEQDARGALSSRGWERLRSLAPLIADCTVGAPPAVDPAASDGLIARGAAYRGIGADAEQWRSLVGDYFDPDDVDRAVCLIDAESGGNPLAENPITGAAGLLQVMPFWAEVFERTHEDLYDPQVNLWMSRQIYELQGWDAWSPYLRGICN